MLKRFVIIISIFFFFSLSHVAMAEGMKAGELLVLCYHAVPFKVSPGDEFSISQSRFVEQMEYLRTHGYQPVSFDDILKAHNGKKKLPEKPVLLTFDDAYISYYEFVVPILKKLGYPSIVAVIGKFIDNPPKELPEPLMNWEQIREVASHRLVDVVSHSYDLHKAIQYNPQGNVGPAGYVRAFHPDTKTYETEDEYRTRIEADFIAQNELLKKKLGFVPRAIVWPYGKYNSITLEVARKIGYQFTFTLEEGFADINNLNTVNRNLIGNQLVNDFLVKEMPIEDFIKTLNKPDWYRSIIRAVQVDLDLIYDPDSDYQTDQNLGKLIDRLMAMKANTVFLQAFADPEGTGNIKSVYFPNRILPVRADIFSHAVHQMIIRDIKVYAWMPTLSIELPDRELNERLKVRALVKGKSEISSSWYRRLTPFSKDVINFVRTMYEDMSAYSQVQGVLFQDDAYLTDTEDYHPLAVTTYREHFGRDILFEDFEDDSELAKDLARFKTERLMDFTNALMEGVRKYRPTALFARNLYADVLIHPESELWFAQNYELFLRKYDQVVIMAYPQMEKEAWINDGFLLEEIRDILASGGRHIAYYPDNFRVDRPRLKVIKLEMSTQTYPFLP